MTRLQEQLQKERDLRVSLEVGSGFDMSQVHVSASINDKVSLRIKMLMMMQVMQPVS